MGVCRVKIARSAIFRGFTREAQQTPRAYSGTKKTGGKKLKEQERKRIISALCMPLCDGSITCLDTMIITKSNINRGVMQ
jgi:hypothetical protein